MDLILDFLSISGMVVNIIILISLVRAKKKELPHQILKLVFVYIFFVLLAYYSYLHQIKLTFMIGVVFIEPAGYFIGPLLYLYIKSLYYKSDGLVKKNLFHFIPFLFYSLVIVFPLIISELRDDPFHYLQILDAYGFEDVEIIFQNLFLMVYCFFSLRLLARYQKTLKLNYSNFCKKDLNWIKQLVIGVLIVIIVDTSASIYVLIVGEIEEEPYFTMVAIVLMIFFLSYKGFTQSKILLPDFLLEEEPTFTKQVEKKTPSHHLVNSSDEEIERLKTRLQEVLEIEKPYLNEDLTLGALAEMIPTTDKKLSALLNHNMEISFYDLINSYRLEEVKSKMMNPAFDKYTFLAIAYDSGFKSKTSFNRVFKKSTGLSPSQYKKQFVLNAQV